MQQEMKNKAEHEKENGIMGSIFYTQLMDMGPYEGIVGDRLNYQHNPYVHWSA